MKENKMKKKIRWGHWSNREAMARIGCPNIHGPIRLSSLVAREKGVGAGRDEGWRKEREIVWEWGRGDTNATQGTLDYEGSSLWLPPSLPRFPFVRIDRVIDLFERNDSCRPPSIDPSARWRSPSLTQGKRMNSRLVPGGNRVDEIRPRWRGLSVTIPSRWQRDLK